MAIGGSLPRPIMSPPMGWPGEYPHMMDLWRRCTPRQNQPMLATVFSAHPAEISSLVTTKWTQIAKCSQVTAYRDILDLVERGVLRKDAGGGRSSG